MIYAFKLISCVSLNIWLVYSSPLTDVMPAGSYVNFFARIAQSRISPSLKISAFSAMIEKSTHEKNPGFLLLYH
jgi:hypothetical protein